MSNSTGRRRLSAQYAASSAAPSIGPAVTVESIGTAAGPGVSPSSSAPSSCTQRFHLWAVRGVVDRFEHPAERPLGRQRLGEGGQGRAVAGEHSGLRSVGGGDRDGARPPLGEQLLGPVEREAEHRHPAVADGGADDPAPLAGDPHRVGDAERARDLGGGHLADAVPDHGGRLDAPGAPERGQGDLHGGQRGLGDRRVVQQTGVVPAGDQVEQGEVDVLPQRPVALRERVAERRLGEQVPVIGHHRGPWPENTKTGFGRRETRRAPHDSPGRSVPAAYATSASRTCSGESPTQASRCSWWVRRTAAAAQTAARSAPSPGGASFAAYRRASSPSASGVRAEMVSSRAGSAGAPPAGALPLRRRSPGAAAVSAGACRSDRGALGEDHVRVGAAEAERADPGDGRPVAVRPGLAARRRPGARSCVERRCAGWAASKCRFGGICRCVQRQRRLDQAGDAGGGLEVADVRLHRAEEAAAGRRARPSARARAPSARGLDRVAERACRCRGPRRSRPRPARRRPAR